MTSRLEQEPGGFPRSDSPVMRGLAIPASAMNPPKQERKPHCDTVGHQFTSHGRGCAWCGLSEEEVEEKEKKEAGKLAFEIGTRESAVELRIKNLSILPVVRGTRPICTWGCHHFTTKSDVCHSCGRTVKEAIEHHKRNELAHTLNAGRGVPGPYAQAVSIHVPVFPLPLDHAAYEFVKQQIDSGALTADDVEKGNNLLEPRVRADFINWYRRKHPHTDKNSLDYAAAHPELSHAIHPSRKEAQAVDSSPIETPVAVANLGPVTVPDPAIVGPVVDPTITLQKLRVQTGQALAGDPKSVVIPQDVNAQIKAYKDMGLGSQAPHLIYHARLSAAERLGFVKVTYEQGSHLLMGKPHTNAYVLEGSGHERPEYFYCHERGVDNLGTRQYSYVSPSDVPKLHPICYSRWPVQWIPYRSYMLWAWHLNQLRVSIPPEVLELIKQAQTFKLFNCFRALAPREAWYKKYDRTCPPEVLIVGLIAVHSGDEYPNSDKTQFFIAKF